MANPFVHIELQTQDVEKSKKFYTAMFDWKLEEILGMDYTIINVGEGTGGGMMKKPAPDMQDNWLPYILVDNVAVSTKKAQALGATRGPGHGVVQCNYRSYRRDFWTLADETRDVGRRREMASM